MEKKKKQVKLLFIFLIFCHQPTLPSLLSGTLVKTPKGLTPLETLKIGDILIGYLEENSLINVCVLDITSNIIETGIILKTTNGEICTVADELFYDPTHNEWIKAQDIIHRMCFFDSQFNRHMFLDVEFVKIPPTITYKIFTTYPHNFFAYDQEILVHNFIPFIGLGATWLFGTGAFEFGGLSIVASIAGVVFGVTLFKQKAKSDNTFHITSSYNGNNGGTGKDPNDDEEKKQDHRKFNTIDKTSFFKKMKKDYSYYRNGIYRRTHKAKGLDKKVEYIKWDHLHNDVEAFDKGGKHLGSYDPETLQLYKFAKPNYIIEVN